jgi:hypothetical protein
VIKHEDIQDFKEFERWLKQFTDYFWEQITLKKREADGQ